MDLEGNLSGGLHAKAAVENYVPQSNKYNQVEAFCLMTYQCETCGKEERLWNSRDGVTPYTIGCRYCGGMASHIRWNEDRRAVNYKPRPGERIFVDMTPERARVLAEKRVEYFKGTAYERPKEETAKLIESLTKDFTGSPTVIEVTASSDDIAEKLLKLAETFSTPGCTKKKRALGVTLREAAELIQELNKK